MDTPGFQAFSSGTRLASELGWGGETTMQSEASIEIAAAIGNTIGVLSIVAACLLAAG